MAEKTNMTKEWVDGVVAKYPPKKLDNGDIRLFGRFAFFQVVGDKPKDKEGKERAWGLVLLIPEGTDMSLPKEEAKALFQEKAPQALTNPDLAKKFNNPFKKQDDYVNTETGDLYDGFVKGRLAMSFNSSKSQPPVVDQRMVPIIDKKDAYSGMWGFVSVKPQWFDVGSNKGPTFYLQSVMKVADDESLGGVGRANPNQAFGDISISADVNPADAFGAASPPADEEVDMFA